MGVHGFMTYVRDDKSKTNTSLKDLIKSDPSKNWIGIDMSILIVKAIRSSQNIIDLLFAVPPRPIDDLSNRICADLSIYKEHGFTIVCVFDGCAHKLKKEQAYLNRYGKNEELKKELQSLYEVSTFESNEDEVANTERVRSIRKGLASFNRPDLLRDMIERIKNEFGNNAVIIGAPFEADLFKQGIIDYVYTNDTDLIVLGCDVILNIRKTKEGKFWMMMRQRANDNASYEEANLKRFF